MKLLIVSLVVALFSTHCVTSPEQKAEKKEAARKKILRPTPGEDVEVMNFSKPVGLQPVEAGWHHETFLRSEPMIITFQEKVGINAIRLDTRDMGSMLFRHVEIPLLDYPYLSWRWMVEKSITKKIDEKSRAGDDRPARIYVAIESESGSKREFEFVWGLRVKKDTIYRIDDFPHYVIRNNGDGLGVWHTEKVNLADVYERIFEETPAGAKVVDIALMADSDDTDLVTSAFFADVNMTMN